MNRKNKFLTILGVVLFSFGILIGMVFLAITTWGNLEAFGFYPSYTADSNLKSLHCPIILTADETAEISVRINNPTDNPISPTITAVISQGFVTYVNEYRETIHLEPGDSYVIRWEINAEDAVYQMFVMARVVLLNSYPLDDMEAACSVFVLNTTFMNGFTILYISLGLYAALTISGYLLWRKFSQHGVEANKHATRGIVLIFILVTLGMIANIFRVWLVGGATFLAGILLIVSSLTLILYTAQDRS